MSYVTNRSPKIQTIVASHRQLYDFDTRGFMLLQGLVSPEGIEASLQALTTLPPTEYIAERATKRWTAIHECRDPFSSVLEESGLLSYVHDVVNQPIRLIESYAHRSGAGSYLYMHNGLVQELEYDDGTRASRHSAYGCDYHDGRLYARYIKAIVYLTDVPNDDGPFCYVEGSHKANFAYPWPALEGATPVPLLSESGGDGLRTVPTGAGDVLLLNEALLHGTRVKSTESVRALLAYSFAPAYMSDWKPLNRSPEDYLTAGYHDLDCEEVFFADDPPRREV